MKLAFVVIHGAALKGHSAHLRLDDAMCDLNLIGYEWQVMNDLIGERQVFWH